MDTFGPSWSRERIGGPVLKEREKEREGGPRACPVSLSVGQLYQTDWYDRLPIKWKPATCYFPDTLLIAAEGRSASFSPHPSSLANLRTRNKVFTPCRGAGKAWTEIASHRRYIRHLNFVDRQVEKNCYIFSYPFDFHFFKWIFMEGKIFRREENTLLRIGVGVFKMRL